ncbi:MAG: iron/manganese transporter [Bacteroidetes bacterium]|nr:MAG: iron/manganese transporter [Bacteroidota bacterium]
MQSEKSLSEIHESVKIPEKRGFWKTLFAFIGPAYLVSVGYMDPGNWATDIAGGSKFGYQLIWVLLMSNLMALLLQSLSARLGIVKGWDLAQASRQQYPQWANFSLYVFAEIAIAACDLAEIIGMAIGLNLLFGLPMLYGVIITVLDTFLLLFLLNKGIRKMEAFILALVAIIGLSFIVQMFIVKPDILAITKGFVPTGLDGDALYIAIAIIGATVMPHNLYLHSALVQTRNFGKDKPGLAKAIKFNFIDSTVALNLAFFVNAAILVLAASAFWGNGHHQVSDIKDAHHLLGGIFGSLAPTLFAIALIAAGQSSTITGTLAGQIIMEGYLNLRISPWLRRIVTRAIAIIPAVITILYFGEHRLGELLVLSQVILSIQLGFAVIPLIHFNSDKALMGEFKIKPWVQLLAWLSAIIIVGLNIKLVISELVTFFDYLGSERILIKVILLAVTVYAGFILLYITLLPLLAVKGKQKKVIPHGEAVNLGELISPNFNQIAVTVDFSKNDAKTINYALSLGNINAKYLLIHIVESAGAIRMGKEILDTEAQIDLINLKVYQADLLKKGYQVDIELGFGKSARIISEIINKTSTDLVVMGAHGHKGIKDIIWGSTVDQVRHLINVPVLIVK